VETLWARGRQLRDGLTRAAAETGLPFAVDGFDPMTAMRFEGLEPDVSTDAWSFLLQEMAQHGVLMRRGGLNFVSYSHGATDIEEIAAAAGEVFAELAPLLAAGTVRGRLRVRETPTAFRSFS